MLKPIIAAAFAVPALHSIPAVAQGADAETDTYRVAIPTADLDLATPAGIKKARGRALRAARRTCGDSVSYMERYPQRRCHVAFMRQVEKRLAELGRKRSSALASR